MNLCSNKRQAAPDGLCKDHDDHQRQADNQRNFYRQTIQQQKLQEIRRCQSQTSHHRNPDLLPESTRKILKLNFIQ